MLSVLGVWSVWFTVLGLYCIGLLAVGSGGYGALGRYVVQSV